MFWCPGCDTVHSLDTTWQITGDDNSPTISPSVLVTTDAPFMPELNEICHSFIREGKIEFLSDCTHKMVGQTVELPEWEDHVNSDNSFKQVELERESNE